MKRVFEKIGLSITALAGISLLFFGISDKKTDPEYQADFRNNYGVYSVPFPSDINFAGESVPLGDPEVYEKLDREILVNTYWQSNGLLLLKRSHKFFPIIEPILEKNNIPSDFKYLAVIESGLTQAVSPAGAKGFWQILEATGKEYGLEITDEIDERYHVEKATQAACDYLNEAYARFGSWTLAAASYNRGKAGLSRQMDRQKEDNYYNLNLNSETGRYVYRIVAVKHILEDPQYFGFKLREKDLYQPDTFQVVRVDSTIEHLADYAHDHGISYKTLKYFNPWLRENSLHVEEEKTYELKLPIEIQNPKTLKDTVRTKGPEIND